jgi:hypothetical protein
MMWHEKKKRKKKGKNKLTKTYHDSIFYTYDIFRKDLDENILTIP